MFKSQIFQRGKSLYNSGNVYLDSQTDTCITYIAIDQESGKEHKVDIYYNSVTKAVSVTCDCTHASLKIKFLPLCAHILAALNRAMYDLGRKKHEQDNKG